MVGKLSAKRTWLRRCISPREILGSMRPERVLPKPSLQLWKGTDNENTSQPKYKRNGPQFRRPMSCLTRPGIAAVTLRRITARKEHYWTDSVKCLHGDFSGQSYFVSIGLGHRSGLDGVPIRAPHGNAQYTALSLPRNQIHASRLSIDRQPTARECAKTS